MCSVLAATEKDNEKIFASLGQMKQLLHDSKLKIPATGADALTNMVELLTDKEMEEHKEEILDLLKSIAISPTNSQLLADTVKQNGLIPKLLKIASSEKSHNLIKKEFKLLATFLAHKTLREIVLGKPLAEITEQVKTCCKKGTCELQWEGLYAFIRNMAKAWPPVPMEKVSL